MSRRPRSPLPELLQVVNRQVVSSQVQHTVEHCRSMSVREHEAVAIRPLRVLRIVPHVFVKQKIRNRRIAQRRSRMAAVGLFHCIDGKKPQGIDRQLVELVHNSDLSSWVGCLGGVADYWTVNSDSRSVDWMTQTSEPSQEGGSRATSKFRPSHLFSSGQNRVKESDPVCSGVVGKSAKEPA